MSSISQATHSAPVIETPAPRYPESEHHVDPGDIAVGVVIGRTSEYFDFFVYGIASVLVFPPVFFPDMARLDGTLWAFAIFSLAFIARPFGTVLSMAVQRRWGRATKLTIALFLLGSSTAGIAFLPSTASLGVASVWLLAAFRIGQGLALGGSWDGLPSLLALNAPKGKRGWYAMLGQLGAPVGFILASGLFAFLYGSLSLADFLSWGWRYPFFVAFAINVVALFARLRLVVAEEYEEQLNQRELEPVSANELVRTQGANIVIGAFAALASYALFHLVTVFPLSWIQLYTEQSIVGFLMIQVLGGFLCAGGIVASGLLADRFGRRRTLGHLAALIAVFSGFAPTLLDGGTLGQDVFILIGFTLLGLSYGQSSGTVTANFAPRYRYTGAALTADVAWLFGAAFAPLVALGLSANFGLGYVSVYLLSGAVCTLGALALNHALESRD
jgi:MFS family permease